MLQMTAGVLCPIQICKVEVVHLTVHRLCYNPVLSATQNSCPPVGDSLGDPSNRLFWEPLKISDIKWNFEKFLVGPDGKPVMRWHPSVNISGVRADIRKYLLQLYTQDVFN